MEQKSKITRGKAILLVLLVVFMLNLISTVIALPIEPGPPSQSVVSGLHKDRVYTNLTITNLTVENMEYSVWGKGWDSTSHDLDWGSWGSVVNVIDSVLIGRFNIRGGDGSPGGNGGDVGFDSENVNLDGMIFNLDKGTESGMVGKMSISYNNFSDIGTNYSDRIRLKLTNKELGSIDWLEEINSTGISNLSEHVIIGNNTVFVNSTILPQLNKSSNITLYGIGDRGFQNPTILKDGEIDCLESGDCHNFTSLTAENVTFNVSTWSNYSVGETPATQYNLTISSTTGGNVTTPGEGIYSYNESEIVEIKAAPDAGYLFVNWTGNVSTIENVTNNETTINITNNFTIFANFEVESDTIAPTFTYIPDNSTLEYATDNLQVDFNATDETGFANFSINHTSNFTIYSNGTLINITALEIGTYILNITINDSSGNENSTLYQVVVEDTTAPTFTDIANITINESTALSYLITASDLSGIETFSVNDTNFTFGLPLGNLINATTLSVGVYHLNITVNDTYNNENSEVIWVNVTALPTPQYYLTITSTTGGNVTTPGEGIFAYNESEIVDIKSTPDIGYLFVNWSGNTSTITNVAVNETTINMTDNFSIVANFEIEPDITPPTFTHIPDNATLEYATDNLQVDFNATDETLFANFSVNHTSNFTIYSNGTLVNITTLEIGTYILNITINDSSGNENSTLYQVDVQDTTPPTFAVYSNVTQSIVSTFSYNFNATDASGTDTFSINLTEGFSVDPDTGVLTNTSSLTLGIFKFNISVNDTYNNTNNVIFSLTVTDPMLPIFTHIPDNATLEYATDNLQVDFNATDETSFANFSVNHTSNFTIYGNGTLVNITTLEIGTYIINVTINDSSTNENSTLYQVDVVDTTLPVFTNLANITLDYLEELNYDINATDASTLSYSINDTTSFNINSTTGILQNKTILSPIEYNLNVSINDGSNIVSQVILINITPLPQPTLIYDIPNVTFTSGSSATLNLSQYFVDADNDTLIYTSISTATFISINQLTSVATLSSSNPGTYYAVFRASDGINYVNSNNITITVQSSAGGGGGGDDEIEEEEAYCGDGSCDSGEDCLTCSFDCGECSAWCGDGDCNGNEDCSSCAADCGQCAPEETEDEVEEEDEEERFSPEIPEGVVDEISKGKATVEGVSGGDYFVTQGRKSDLASVPCYESESQVEMIPIEGYDLIVPEGKEVVVDPFELKCNKETVKFTVAVPYNYADFEVHVCKGGVCGPVQMRNVTKLLCDNGIVREHSRDEEIYTPEIQEIELPIIEKSLDVVENELISGNTTATFTGDLQDVKAKLENIRNPVRQPLNPNLRIISTPIQLDLDNATTLNLTLTMPYRFTENIDEQNLKIYALSSDKWHLIGGQVNTLEKEITVNIENLTSILNSEGKTIFAILGTICINCHNATLQKIYAPDGGSRAAVIMVHGFASSPAAFQALINDFALTKQPVEIWTYGYPHNRHISENSEEFSKLLEENTANYDKIIIVAHSLGGVISQYALWDGLDKDRQYFDKVRELILIGVPNNGLDSIEGMSLLANAIANTKTVYSMFDLDSQSIQDLKAINTVEKVPGVKYRVLAGTRPYLFKVGPITISSEKILNLTGLNDGLLTTLNVQTFGKERISNSCEDYWELNLTHTELNDDERARLLIGMIVSNEIGIDKVDLSAKKYIEITVPGCDNGDKVYVTANKMWDADKKLDLCQVYERLSSPGTCNDGIKNQGEEGVDCGKVCNNSCLDMNSLFAKTKFLLYFIVIGLVTIIAISGIKHHQEKIEYEKRRAERIVRPKYQTIHIKRPLPSIDLGTKPSINQDIPEVLPKPKQHPVQQFENQINKSEENYTENDSSLDKLKHFNKASGEKRDSLKEIKKLSEKDWAPKIRELSQEAKNKDEEKDGEDDPIKRLKRLNKDIDDLMKDI